MSKNNQSNNLDGGEYVHHSMRSDANKRNRSKSFKYPGDYRHAGDYAHSRNYKYAEEKFWKRARNIRYQKQSREEKYDDPAEFDAFEPEPAQESVPAQEHVPAPEHVPAQESVPAPEQPDLQTFKLTDYKDLVSQYGFHGWSLGPGCEPERIRSAIDRINKALKSTHLQMTIGASFFFSQIYMWKCIGVGAHRGSFNIQLSSQDQSYLMLTVSKSPAVDTFAEHLITDLNRSDPVIGTSIELFYHDFALAFNESI